MHINLFEIANLVIVFILIVVVMRAKGLMPMMWALFIYGTLHFSFGAFALIGSDSRAVLLRLHIEGSGLLAKIAYLSLLCVIFIMLAKDAYQAHLRGDKSKNRTVMYFLVTMLVIFIGFLINLRVGDWMQLKNIISIEACLTLMLLSFLTVKKFELFDKIKTCSLGSILLLMFFMINCIAVYEVFGQHAWANAIEKSGESSWRASSVFFNPNLFGFWGALIYIACAFGMYVYPTRRMMMLMGMILAAIALYLSSSRSMILPLICVLLISSVLIKESFRWIPLLLLLTVWASIYAISACLAQIVLTNNAGWKSVALLGERLAFIPVDLLSYGLRTDWFKSVMESDVMKSSMTSGVGNYIAREFDVLIGSEINSGVLRSIEGRLMGGDSGWRVIYQDAGLFGLSGIVLASCILVIWSIRAYITSKSTQSIYTFLMLIFCLFSGFVIRFQLFPIWIFIALVMLPCLVFLQKTKIQPYYIGSIKI
ncbi:hypothetical protein N8157_01185 [Burkholderiales bacterium]|nr:hypothetical protein [Burkholderiales bacterium]